MPSAKVKTGKYNLPLPIKTAFEVCKTDKRSTVGDDIFSREIAVDFSAVDSLANSILTTSFAPKNKIIVHKKETAIVIKIALFAILFFCALSVCDDTAGTVVVATP